MSTCSLAYLAFCCLTAMLFRLLQRRAQRQALLTVVNIAFLYLLVPNPISWAWLVFFIGISYILLRTVDHGTTRNHLELVLGFVLTVFVGLKGYAPAWFGAPPGSTMAEILSWLRANQLSPVELVGLSYMLFKFIHVAVDRWQEQLAPLNFTTYANYQLSFFTLVAGPIQRYNDFNRYWQEVDVCNTSTRQLLLAWCRILTGTIKMGAIGPVLYEMFVQAQGGFGPQSTASLLARFAVYFYAYPIYMYFNFSGYTDVAIGSARLLGFELPENFDRPFLARNVVDFWNRWHITLTHWIRDYVFMTSYKAGAERFPGASKLLGYGLLFGSLLLAGLWHGVTPEFAVFGAIHGLGAGAGRAYGDAMKFLLGRGGMQRYLKSRLIHALAVFVTFHFVCFSFLFFSSGEMAPIILRTVYGQLRSPLSIGPSFHLELRSALSLFPWMIAARQPSATRKPSTLYKVVLLKTILVVLLFCWAWAAEQKDPVVVYMRF